MRSVADLLGGAGGDFGIAAGAGAQPSPPVLPPAPGMEPLGYKTGAPPRIELATYQVIPASAVGAGRRAAEPTRVCIRDPQSRVAIFQAPLLGGFVIYIGDAGIASNPGANGLALPAGLPYEVIIPGGQEIYAVTNAPVYLPLRVQIASILIGDRERRW